MIGVTMADVLHGHQDAPAENGGRYCICGEWFGPWTGTSFAVHQERVLSAAGFGHIGTALDDKAEQEDS